MIALIACDSFYIIIVVDTPWVLEAFPWVKSVLADGVDGHTSARYKSVGGFGLQSKNL